MNSPTANSVIAIDGPAASGKSTIGSQLAGKKGYLYFDTGVMYRAVTAEALSRKIPVDDEKAVTELAQEIRIDILPPHLEDGRDMTLHIDGIDRTWDIRARAVDQNVSRVSAYAGVRDAMVEQQRRIGNRGRVVMVGRDIGTVVFPKAAYKIYLDASAEERARRRHLERQARGEQTEYDAVLAEIKRRDEIDSTRSVAPLKMATDAAYVDSTDLPVHAVLDRVLEIVDGKAK